MNDTFDWEWSVRLIRRELMVGYSRVPRTFVTPRCIRLWRFYWFWMSI